MRKIAIIFSLLSGLTACNTVDNYLLGKDNMPKPKPLAPITSKVHIKETWSVALGKASQMRGYLKIKPSKQGHVIYVADASGLVQAVDDTKGRVIWSKKLTHGVVSGPALSEGYLVIGTNASKILVLRQTDGHIMWKRNVSSDVLSQALIVNHKVIVKTIDGHLYAFHLTTGETLWVADHGAPSLILKASSSPVMMGNVILVGFSDGKLDGIDIESGRTLWQRSMVYATGASDIERLVDIDADPIVRDNIVYLASYQGYVGALSMNNGQFVWNRAASVYKNMAMNQDTLFVTDSHDVLWALDSQTGQVRWKQTTLKARGLSEPVLMGSWLLVGDKTGYLHVLSVHNGDVLARKQLSGAIDISPTVFGQTVYVMTANGHFDRLTVTS